MQLGTPFSISSIVPARRVSKTGRKCPSCPFKRTRRRKEEILVKDFMAGPKEMRAGLRRDLCPCTTTPRLCLAFLGSSCSTPMEMTCDPFPLFTRFYCFSRMNMYPNASISHCERRENGRFGVPCNDIYCGLPARLSSRAGFWNSTPNLFLNMIAEISTRGTFQKCLVRSMRENSQPHRN